MKYYKKSNMNGKSAGQVLVLVALIFLGLMAAIGLAVDTGLVFINYANLRRAVDSASLAAATQYRLNVSEISMKKIAIQYLKLNKVEDPGAVVTTCDTEPGLCPNDGTGLGRKLVHVRASSTIKTYFISLLGFDNITVNAESVAEAASLDVILVLDTSESMTFGEDKNNAAAHGGVDMRDPINCNGTDPTADPLLGTDGYPGDCHPFQEVKEAAVGFVNQLYFPYDRVGVITFDRWSDSAGRLDLTNNKSTIIDYIKNRKVTPWMQTCPWITADKATNGPCADYSKGYYELSCTTFLNTSPNNDPTPCGTTNIGSGMEIANKMVTLPGLMRQNSLWVIILLTDGAANASVNLDDPLDPGPADVEYFGYCPASTWVQQPFCRDPFSDPYSAIGVHRHAFNSAGYDSADYAYDAIDKVADRKNNAASKLIYSIGLGNLVTSNTACIDPATGLPYSPARCDPEAGQKLLEYAADKGDGVYYFAPTTNQLQRVFQAIAENIAFRLTH